MTPPPPFLISWNLTRRCNLRCAHCYLDAEQLDGGGGDLGTDEALRIVERIAAYCPGAMLILTGGEPLLRDDLWTIAAAAVARGLTPVLGTNGALLTPEIVTRIREVGIQGVGVSLDAVQARDHDRFRGQPGAWAATMAGIDEMIRQGVTFQVQFSVTRGNLGDVPGIIELARAKGARAVNIFFLVCTGRGQQMTDITPAQYEETLAYLARAEADLAGEIMVRARCAPHYLRVTAQLNPGSAINRGATSGCIAGRGYFRITPEGDVTPCPYMPEPVGNLLREPLAALWEEGTVMRSLRDPVYNGKCGDCAHREACGGCRARALSSGGDLMGEDPWCVHEPDAAQPQPGVPEPPTGEPVWDDAARERLGDVPLFLRAMVKGGVERYAREKGITRITPELMKEMRSRVHAR